jgi:adenylate cyclase
MDMSARYKNSISKRYNLAFIVILTLIMSGFAATATAITINRISQDLGTKLENYLRISTIALETPLWNFDHKITKGYLDSLMLDESIVYANVLAADGTINNRIQSSVKGMTFSDFVTSSDYSTLEGQVMKEGNKIGQIELAISRATIRNEIRTNILAILALTLLVLTTVVATSVVISRRYITRPLSKLQKSAASIGSGNLEIEIDVSGQDEIGFLAREFDGMRNAIHRLVGELKKSNEKLERANRGLEDRVEERTKEVVATQQKLVDAIGSTSEGFAFFDAEDFLVLHNARYVELLYGGTDILIKPGMSFEQILRLGVETGLIADNTEDIEGFIQKRIAQHNDPKGTILQRRGDDIWLQISERKISDGGTVAVFSDVSDLKKREADLTEKTVALEHLSNQLSKYLSPQIYDSIFDGRQEVKVASSRKKLTVFFSDIVGFTETAEQMESEELTTLLNSYLTEMTKIALDHGATIDKYIGDAILIFFGDPETRGAKQDAVRCVDMAIAMSERMGILREIWTKAGIIQPLEIRIGIHTDYCTVGNFGSESRLDYTIIGRGVNTASRLETAADPGKILISHATHALVKDDIPCVSRGQVEVKGIARPLDVYEVSPGEELPLIEKVLSAPASSKLELDVNSLSGQEREKFADLLRTLLCRIQKDDDAEEKTLRD